MTDNDQTEAEAVLASIQAEQDKTLSALRVDARMLYLVWAVAWAVGFVGLWLAGRAGSPFPIWAAVLLLVIVFALATLVSTRHTMRQVAGVRPASPWQGMVYGWGWMFGFLVLVALGIRLAMLDLPGAPALMVLPAVGLLVCGLQFLAGAALWGDRSQLVVGAAVLVAAGVSLFIPTPTNLLAVAVLLGVGFAICGLLAGRGPEPVTQLDPVIHPQGRLRVMAVLDALGQGASITFTRLQDLLEMTPGNLITHLRRLEEAGYVITDKEAGKRGTDVFLTDRGATAFAVYRQTLQDMLAQDG